MIVLTPDCGYTYAYGRLAQLVERRLYTSMAAGSSPASPTKCNALGRNRTYIADLEDRSFIH